MTPSAISLAGVGKRYVKYDDAPMLVTRIARLRARTRRSQLWALRHADVEVQPGEFVGVVGRNGSGKSTMLRMLAGVTAPTEGVVRVRGRVAPLISVGVGFHPELTGRENVYVNGTVLGLSRAQIDRRLEEIVDFAEVGDFIDTPVKFYSSGMFVRLGFAVAVSAEPDVLLVDEVLAVGDLAFQIKCYNRMLEIKERGTTIVVVSHNLNMVRTMCRRCLVLHDGGIRFDGATEEALSIYHRLLGERQAEQSGPLDTRPQGIEPDARFDPVVMLGVDAAPTAHATTGDEVCFRFRVRFDRPVADPVLEMLITSDTGVAVFRQFHPFPGASYGPGDEEVFEARMPLRLATGSYTALANVLTQNDFVPRAVPPDPFLFWVSGPQAVTGLVDLDARFSAGAAVR